jgi:hypothetical protein
MDDDNPRMRRLTYRPVLMTTEGEMPLSNTTSRRPEDFGELLAHVRAAIGATDAEQGSAVVDLVRAGRTVDAITVARRELGLSLEGARERVQQIQRDLKAQAP